MASIIVAGATGAIGRTVVQMAIQQPWIGRVVTLTRSQNIDASNYGNLFGITTAGEAQDSAKRDSDSPCDTLLIVTPEEAAKIEPVTLDWEALTQLWVTERNSPGAATNAAPDAMEAYRNIFRGHTCAAMCLGTTRKDAGSARRFIRCDYDYVMAFTEAVLMFSAPAGLAPDTLLMHQIGDEGLTKHARGPQRVGDGMDASQSSRTLRVLCQVSASGACSSSWFLYMKTKGAADDSTVERVYQHNIRTTSSATLTPVNLILLRPGLLERYGKARGKERLAKLFLSALPAGTCGTAIVSLFKHFSTANDMRLARDAPPPHTQAVPVEAEAERVPTADTFVGTCGKEMQMGTPYKAPKSTRNAGVPLHEPLPCIFEADNSAIKDIASRLGP